MGETAIVLELGVAILLQFSSFLPCRSCALLSTSLTLLNFLPAMNEQLPLELSHFIRLHKNSQTSKKHATLEQEREREQPSPCNRSDHGLLHNSSKAH